MAGPTCLTPSRAPWAGPPACARRGIPGKRRSSTWAASLAPPPPAHLRGGRHARLVGTRASRQRKGSPGFYLSGHPLARYRQELSSYTTHTLGKLPESGIVRVGHDREHKKTITKNGHAMKPFQAGGFGRGGVRGVPQDLHPALAKILVARDGCGEGPGGSPGDDKTFWWRPWRLKEARQRS